jgi:FtsH-binding integral membrane protein
MDIDNIPFGLDFREHVKAALLENDILIAVIGPKWVGSDGSNRIRIVEETDPVRIEVETALARDIPVVPVLVGGAAMPAPGELPDGLKDLTFRNAAHIDAGRDFHQHMERLIRSMDLILEQKASPPNHGAITTALAKHGLRFPDPQMEADFRAWYRQQFYALGRAANGLAVVAWLLFGSAALVASQGSDFKAIKFFYIAAPLLLVVFLAGFSKPAQQAGQIYNIFSALVFITLAYTSARVLQEESWYRPEYVTMAFMAGLALTAMLPVLTLYAITLEAAVAAVGLYYMVYDLRMPEVPPLYPIFSGLFVVVSMLAASLITMTREQVLRRQFAAARGLRQRGSV